MKVSQVAAIVCLVVASGAAAAPARPARSQASRPASRPAASRPAEIQDDPRLPRVLIIGDSISIGYTEPARALLAGKANLHRIPTNGGPTTRGLEQLDRWLGEKPWDVIHFNWGLHDLRLDDGKHQVPSEQYERHLRDLVGRLRRPRAPLTWAGPPPGPAAKLSPPRRNSDVIAYNAVARRIMAENGVLVDDLYAFALPRLSELQLPANVHFKDAGSAALAERVAASILDALRARGAQPQSAPASRPARERIRPTR